jgi:drug/metabolite transporter (DMT)-like permease
LTYGLQNFVDFLSSVVAFWRFYCPGTLTKERVAVLVQREARAGVAISFFILVLGVLVIMASVGDLNAGPKDADEGLAIVAAVSFASIIVYTIMTAFKLRYARKLQSDALLKDGLCSLIGVFLSIIICVNSWIINESPDLWRLDASFAIFCGLFALGIGLHGLVYAYFVQGLPICSPEWWWSAKQSALEMAEGGTENGTEEKTKLSEVV